MTFQAMSLVASIKKRPEICVIKKCLLLCMANYANDKFELWPSYKTLSEDACISRRSAVAHIDQLINLGVISRQKRPINNTYSKSNVYRLEIIQWLKSIGFELRINNDGFIIATPIGSGTAPPPSAGDALPSAGDALPSAGDALPLVQEAHYPSAGDAPNPVKEPIIKPIIQTNTKETPPSAAVSVDGDYSFQIFIYWCKVMCKDVNERFTPKAERAVQARLKEGYSVEDIKQAIDGCAGTDFYMGRLPGKPKKHNRLDLICRDKEKLDDFIEMNKTNSETKSIFDNNTDW